MTSIADAVTTILAGRVPAPVLVLDTCVLLDLFRWDGPGPRILFAEIKAANHLLEALALGGGELVRLVAPELVPGEFADNADSIQGAFKKGLEAHDKAREWLDDAGALFDLSRPVAPPTRDSGISTRCRALAMDLLDRSIVLDRDRACLDRAVDRLIAKRRPSHRKEIKDSMNLEQGLELARRLREAGSTAPCLFISSNTKDFANETRTDLHPDLRQDFKAAGLEYFTSLTAAVGSLRGRTLVP